MIEYNYNGIMRKIIPLDEMEVGVYKGQCRNANYAYWDGQKFTHLRTKFHHTYLEEIHHPENEQVYDVFLVFEKVEEDDDNAVQLMNAINGAIEQL